MLKRFMLIAFILMLVLAACASPTPPPAPTGVPTVCRLPRQHQHKCRRGCRPPPRPSSPPRRFVTPSIPASST